RAIVVQSGVRDLDVVHTAGAVGVHRDAGEVEVGGIYGVDDDMAKGSTPGQAVVDMDAAEGIAADAHATKSEVGHHKVVGAVEHDGIPRVGHDGGLSIAVGCQRDRVRRGAAVVGIKEQVAIKHCPPFQGDRVPRVEGNGVHTV